MTRILELEDSVSELRRKREERAKTRAQKLRAVIDELEKPNHVAS